METDCAALSTSNPTLLAALVSPAARGGGIALPAVAVAGLAAGAAAEVVEEVDRRLVPQGIRHGATAGHAERGRGVGEDEQAFTLRRLGEGRRSHEVDELEPVLDGDLHGAALLLRVAGDAREGAVAGVQGDGLAAEHRAGEGAAAGSHHGGRGPRRCDGDPAGRHVDGELESTGHVDRGRRDRRLGGLGVWGTAAPATSASARDNRWRACMGGS